MDINGIEIDKLGLKNRQNGTKLDNMVKTYAKWDIIDKIVENDRTGKIKYVEAR